MKNVISFRERFLSDFYRSWGRKWSQVRTKNEAEIEIVLEDRFFKKCSFSFRKTYIRVEPRDAKVEEKTMEKRMKNGSQLGRDFSSIFHRFLIFFLVPARRPKPRQNP